MTLNQIQKEGKKIIDSKPKTIVSTTKFHPSEPEEPKEGVL
jgi:hypothetical protein